MAGDPPQLGDQHPQVLGLLRQLEPQQLFDDHGPTEIHVHPGQVIHAVRVGNVLAGRQVLTDLFRATVQIADVRRDLRHDFAVRSQHEAQHAVSAGVLGPHIHQHFVGPNVKLDDAWIACVLHHGVFRPLTLMPDSIPSRARSARVSDPAETPTEVSLSAWIGSHLPRMP